MFQVERAPQELSFGRQGESNILSYAFDFSEWAAEWPGGLASMTVVLPNQTQPQPIPDTQAVVDGTIITLHVLDNLTGKDGRGTLIIRYVAGENKKRSRMIEFVVEKGHETQVGSGLAVVEDWVDEAVKTLDDVKSLTFTINDDGELLADDAVLGSVRLNYKGPHNPATEYRFNNWVSANGGSYVYIYPTPSTGVPLTDTSHWHQIADKGDTPNIEIGTVTTGAEGTDASATIGGTAENPVLNLTIPRGNTGAPTSTTPTDLVILDVGGYYATKNVEAALNQAGSELKTLKKYRLFLNGTYDFEQGSIANGSNTEIASNYWIRSPYLLVDEIVGIPTVASGYNVSARYFDINYAYKGFETNPSGANLMYPAGTKYVRLLVGSASVITPSSPHGFSVKTKNLFVSEELTKKLYSSAAASDAVLEQGSISHSDGAEAAASNYIRVRGYVPVDLVRSITYNPDVRVRVFYYGTNGTFLVMVQPEFGSTGYTIPFNSAYKYVRFSIQNSTGTNILPTDTTGFVMHGLSKFYEDDYKYKYYRDFILANRSSLPITTSCFVGTDYLPINFSAICVTDLHGVFRSLDDAYALQTFYAPHNTGIKIFNLGDIIAGRAKENNVYDPSVALYMSKAVAYGVYHSVGQHECGYYDTDVGRSKSNCLSHAEVFSTFIEPMKTVWGLPSLTTNYYYKDFANNTRLISLYQYNIPLVDDPADSDRYKYSRSVVWYGQDQLDWLIATLNSTPAGYNVIILMHQSDANVVDDGSAFFTAETIGGNRIIDGTPIVDIVNAYINKTTLSETYTCVDTVKYPAELFSMTASADFTGALGSFANYYMGDSHIDYVGVIDGTNQRVIGLTSNGQSYDCSVKNVKVAGGMGKSGEEFSGKEGSIVTAIGYDYTHRVAKIGRLGQQYALTGQTRAYESVSIT